MNSTVMPYFPPVRKLSVPGTFSRFLTTALLCYGGPLLAQSPPVERPDTARGTRLSDVTVTATRTPMPALRVPHPVSVLDSLRLRTSVASSAVELLREGPGLDLTGTGPNQGRPVIRGQRGQRILLLEDGIRINNSRRQQDFGELPALVGMAATERVEVVRGPLSVLYGSDAIGGVVNLITEQPTYGGSGTRVRGSLRYRYSTIDGQQQPTGRFFGEMGGFGFGITGGFRDAQAYSAPSGQFGNVSLASKTAVMDTGVRDGNGTLEAGYGFSGRHTVFARYSRYHADDAGFGWVDNAALGTPDAPVIKIRYPDQDYQKFSLTYRGNTLGLPFADRAEVTTYASGNTRDLTLAVFVPFGPGTPPGAGVNVDSRN